MEPDEWEIEADELELGPRIGIGSFGEVYRGTWRHTDVAVKKFLEQDLSPQLMQVRLSWHCSFCMMRPGGLFQKMTLCVDVAVKKFLEQDLSPQLMQVRLSWRLKRKREKDYTFWHQFDEKRSIVLGCSDWHCNLCTLRLVPEDNIVC